MEGLSVSIFLLSIPIREILKSIVSPTKAIKAINGTDVPKNLGLCMSIMFLNSHTELCIGVFHGLNHSPSQALVFWEVGYSSSFPSPKLFRFTFRSPSSSAEIEFIPIIRVMSLRATERARSWTLLFKLGLFSKKTLLTWNQPPIGFSTMRDSLVNTEFLFSWINLTQHRECRWWGATYLESLY